MRNHVFLLLTTFLTCSCGGQNKNLIQAICTDDTESVSALLKAGQSPNSFIDQNGKIFIPMIIATDAFYCGRPIQSLQFVKILKEYGADVDQTDQGNVTPLMAAVGSVDIETVKFLVDSSANINAQDTRGYSPLMWISSDPRSLEIVKYLVLKGADPKVANQLGENAYEHALKLNNSVAIFLKPLVIKN
jgi:Ankyrin repeats (3 copies)